jgi:iron complex transport system permease protein
MFFNSKLNAKNFILGLISGVIVLVALVSGDHFFSFRLLLKIFYHPAQWPLESQIIWDIRLPRILAAFITGALLALSGLIMQILLRNPLADPYILGISGGSSTFILLLSLLSCPYGLLKLGSWLGSLLSFFIVWFLSARRIISTYYLLLVGVMLSFVWSAFIALLLAIAPENSLQGMVFWLLGDLDNVQFSFIEPLILLVGIFLIRSWSHEISVLTLGQIKAASLGVNVKPLHIKLLLLSTLLTAAAVSLGGAIGFIGLIVPQLLRLWGIYSLRSLIWGCVLGGGSLLLLADTLARTLFAPHDLPVGVFTALLGIPLFFAVVNYAIPLKRL